MIHVIATVTVKPGKLAQFLDIFKALVPAVLAEDGCIAYEPTIDAVPGLDDTPDPRPDVAVVVEQWQSLDHLKAHIDAPHMATFRDQTQDIVESVHLSLLEPA